MSVKSVREKFDAIDEQIPINTSCPVHCTDEEGCRALAEKVYDLIHGVCDDGDDI